MNQRVDKLDDAFLFSLALTGIIISFAEIEVNKSDWTQIIGIIPFLFLGILLPFIIGYLRGAISLNSAEERLRGWIYFFIGISSYLGFFIINRLGSIDYFYRETIFSIVITIGVLITYGFLKWSKEIFNIHSLLSTYAFSATSLGAFVFSFLSSLIVGLFYDFEGKNILNLIYPNPIALFFWISIILFSSTLLLIFEKASKYAIQHPLELRNEHLLIQTYPAWLRRILNIFFLKGLFLGCVLFEYTFDYNLKARVLWILSFVCWFLGCLLWSSFGIVYFTVTIISCFIAMFFFYKTRISTFQDLDKALPFKIGYGLSVFLITVLFILLGNIQLLIITIILFTIIFVLPKVLFTLAKSKINT
jgi:hypothetical protein